MMRIYLDTGKAAIKDHSVFNGLAVDDRQKFSALFMHPQFKLLTMCMDGKFAHVIFEEWDGVFVFHLVNFTAMTTKTMTQDFIEQFVIPYCKERGLSAVQASVERKGMARKLSALGFEPLSGNVHRKEVNHVF